MTINTSDRRTARPAPARPAAPAHVIRDDAEAIEVATRLAPAFREGAAERDRDRRLPEAELDEYSQSGLWGIIVPRTYGGAEVSWVTVARVFAIISAADASIGQIPQNHFAEIDSLRRTASEEQQRHFFGLVLGGVRTGNAFAEFGSKTTGHFETRLTPDGEGFRINGRKFYSTGALLSHVVTVSAADADDNLFTAFVERDAEGLEIIDDWSSFGQRTTASGTVVLDDVYVPASQLVGLHRAFDAPSPTGPIAQIMQAAIDHGIAVEAVADTIRFVRTHSRPWIDANQDHAHDDVYTIAAIGDLEVKLHASELILERAGRLVDAAVADPTEDTVAAASVAVAESKILSTEAAILATNKLFELAGTRSTLATHALDRHWRNARTHTLHDPVRWKYRVVGDYYLNGVHPARHAWV
jgi:SfnB family sulfur acquisition oxidoreductase